MQCKKHSTLYAFEETDAAGERRICCAACGEETEASKREAARELGALRPDGSRAAQVARVIARDL